METEIWKKYSYLAAAAAFLFLVILKKSLKTSPYLQEYKILSRIIN